MNKVTWIVLAAVWMVTGCAQKAPSPNGNASDANEITIDAVTMNEEIAEQADDLRYNSSSAGFMTIYFDFNGYDIVPSMQKRVERNIENLQVVGGSKIKIEGNCDEFGTDEYNYALGLKRAKAIKDAFIDRGVNVSNVVLVSLGEGNPVCSESTDLCYARNRRVDFHLVK